MTITADRRALRAEQKRSERRDAILRAAGRVFCSRGYPDASISDVIDAAGISRGTFYLYFDGKDALYLELIERFTALMTAALVVVDPAGPDPARGIRENVGRVVDVAFDHPELTLLVLRESRGVNPEIDQRLDRLYDFLHGMVEGALVNGASSGLTRQVSARVIAPALIGAFKEVFLRHLDPAGPTRTDRRALVDALFEFGIRGLLLERSGSSSPPPRKLL
ncbi:MAG TPA: TetR/AcrR family transcriptional regulator [Polyangiales bacterium]|jgi:AcrR family transcriptional regulator